MVSLLGRELFLHRSQRLQARSCAATALRSPTLVFPQLLAAAISRAVRPSRLASKTAAWTASAAASCGASRPAIKASSGPPAGPTKLPGVAVTLPCWRYPRNSAPGAMAVVYLGIRQAGGNPALAQASPTACPPPTPRRSISRRLLSLHADNVCAQRAARLRR